MNQKKNPSLPEAWDYRPIRAWRMWHVEPFTMTLKSLTMPGIWPREQPPAECAAWSRARLSNLAHNAPYEECQCGYWSIKPEYLTQPHMWEKIAWSFATITRIGMVGWVENWGNVVEFEYGYRSQYAKVTGLIDLPNEWIAEHGADWWGGDHFGRHQLTGYREKLSKLADKWAVPIVGVHG